MFKSLLALVVLSLSATAVASDWKTIDTGTVGVVSADSTASLELTTIVSEKNDHGLAFYFYPADQPTHCEFAVDVYKEFAVNGQTVAFKKFCMEGAKNTAYTPADYTNASKLVGQLTRGDLRYVNIEGQQFSTVGFAEQVEKLLAD